MKIQNLRIAAMLFVLAVFFTGCSKDENNETPPASTDVGLKFYFNQRVGVAPLYFDSLVYQNAFGNVYSVATLKYFISDITLHNADGTEVLIDEEHYVDARDNDTKTFTPASKIPAGTYTSISFIFGLNEAKNVAGRYPNPPENNMEWPPAMGTGYHYMKLEGKIKVDSTGTTQNYQAHTGPSMGNAYYIEVEVPLNFTFNSGDEKIVSIAMDVNKWWNNPNEIDLNNITSIMGNQEIQQQLHDNGADVFYLEGVE